MELKVITIYCICDDLIKSKNIQDHPQSRMTYAEILTTGIVAALFYRGNVQNARLYLLSARYISNMLSHSRINRRLLSIDPDLWQAILILCSHLLIKKKKSSGEFIVDSFPMPVCHPSRSWRCKLYQGKEYLGYCAAKKLHYFGLKIHVIISLEGAIVEFLFTPASTGDISGLRLMNLDLPEGGILYGDRAYQSAQFEAILRDDAHICLVTQKRRNSKTPLKGPLAFLQKTYRRGIETAFSQITRLMGRFISAKSRKGFELRVFWFLLAYSIEKTMKV